MNPSEDNNFIMEDNIPELENPIPAPAPSFSIVPHLLVLGFILFSLFATIIIPKSLSVLHPEKIATPAGAETFVKETSVLPAAVSAFENIPLRAKSAYVWDVTNQKALFSLNAEEALPLASITKLMTALVTYELLPDNTAVTVSPAAAQLQSGGGFRSGEVFVAKDLANFALISSYNSAAFTLAAAAGALLGDNDPATQFVNGMNIKAEELNLQSLKFYNPTGLDISTTEAGAYGNSKDVSLLMEYILTNYPEILDPTVKTHTRLYNKAGEYHEADNTNDIVSDIPNLLGSKTGYTDLAGGNLTIVFDAGFNHPIIITVLGSTYYERFNDVKKLVTASVNYLKEENK